jgi:hypothetical protein
MRIKILKCVAAEDKTQGKVVKNKKEKKTKKEQLWVLISRAVDSRGIIAFQI